MAKEEAKDGQTPAEGSQPQAKKKSLMKWIVIGLAVLIVVGVGAFGALYLSKNATAKQDTKKSAVAAMWSMEPFIVNLLDQQSDRYLKVIIELEVSDQGCLAELNQMKPRLRDNILDLLTSKTYKELADISGKQRLRDEIGLRLNSFLTTGKIVKVYFTEFVIQ